MNNNRKRKSLRDCISLKKHHKNMFLYVGLDIYVTPTCSRTQQIVKSSIHPLDFYLLNKEQGQEIASKC